MDKFSTAHVHPVKDRFSELALGAGQQAQRTVYRCAHCATTRVLTTKCFTNAQFDQASPLPDQQVALINQARSFTPGNWEAFYDFTCQGCARAVRIIYLPNEYRMGVHFFRLKAVIVLN